MNINQHNYEEFFLLYADGELSAQDKLAVEQFVQENPYLAEELEMFLQLKLPVEDIVFEDKSSLFKHNETIGLKNHEEYFLLYVDNELDAAGKQSVERFVLQHPALQEQFMQLKQTRLEPETIVCPDKASLYKKEEKERRVFYMRWQRIAVAAAFIGLAVLGWKLFPSNGEAINAPVTAQQLPAVLPNSNAAGSETNTSPNETTTQPVIAKPSVVETNTAVAQLNNNSASTNTTSETALIAENNVTVSQPDRITMEPATTIQTQNLNEGTRNRMEQKLVDKPIVTAALTDDHHNDNITQPAIYRELNTDTDDEKKSLYVGSIEINKDKLRGFFRKAGSLFRGKAKQQEEEERTETTPSSNTRSLK